MAAYVILDVTVTDPVGYEEYRKLATPTVAAYGGKYLVRGGKVETLEGNWNPGHVVVLEFESVARARQWLSSPEYCAAQEWRHKAAVSNLIIVEGV